MGRRFRKYQDVDAEALMEMYPTEHWKSRFYKAVWRR